MALHIPKPPGVAQMLKEGARYFTGLDEAVFRNIVACTEFTQTLRSAYGPNGMNKLIINHIQKQFLTNDAATVIRELEVEHPAVKIMILSSKMQDAEIGDGTNFVVILVGCLLEAAEELLRLGILATNIIDGYEIALEKCVELLPKLCCGEITNVLDTNEVKKAIRSALMSKQYGNEDFLADLVTKACIFVATSHKATNLENIAFNVDNVRVIKILGAGVNSSEIIQGMVFKSDVESTIKNVNKAKIVVYNCAIDISQTESKGTVLIKSADELVNFSRGEEDSLELVIKAIAEAGVNVIVAGAKFGDMALHFMNKYNLMAVRLNSKFELRRLSKTINATVLPKICVPTKEEIGNCENVYCNEIGETRVVIFKQPDNESKISTIVIRGSTDNAMDDIERAIDDGVNTYKVLTRDGTLLPGAGATEIELGIKLSKYADTLSGLEQYSVRKFASAFEQFPKIIAENSGLDANLVMEKLFTSHHAGSVNNGVDIESENDICDANEKQIYDLYLCKLWGIRYASIAAATILRIDQLIMAKKAGGPQPRDAADSDAE